MTGAQLVAGNPGSTAGVDPLVVQGVTGARFVAGTPGPAAGVDPLGVRGVTATSMTAGSAAHAVKLEGNIPCDEVVSIVGDLLGEGDPMALADLASSVTLILAAVDDGDAHELHRDRLCGGQPTLPTDKLDSVGTAAQALVCAPAFARGAGRR